MKRNPLKNLNKLSGFQPEAILDYHGFGVLDPYEVEEILNNFMYKAYEMKLVKVLVITGKGRLIKQSVPGILKKVNFVKSFQIASSANGGEGALEILLK